MADSHGLFVSPPLSPGDYDVEVQLTGFNKEIQHVHLEVARRAALSLILVLGNASETVNVEANASLLGTETSTLSNPRTETAVKNLSLDGRNFAELVGLSAGVAPRNLRLPQWR